MEITIVSIQDLISWLLSHGLKILLILIAANLINRFLKTFIKKVVKRQIKNKISQEEEKKRVETLLTIFEGTLKFIVWIVTVLMILPELGINIAPILAGVGVVGLAVGMAARGIISDFISGLFIILENQYHTGDKIKIAGLEGEVKEITLRRTIIKDKEGVSHSIPNSKITIVSKKS
ncbi:MAG: mechanosensitive ion channel family protein [Candidatus Nealsonbacteria bacterium]